MVLFWESTEILRVSICMMDLLCCRGAAPARPVHPRGECNGRSLGSVICQYANRWTLIKIIFDQIVARGRVISVGEIDLGESYTLTVFQKFCFIGELI